MSDKERTPATIAEVVTGADDCGELISINEDRHLPIADALVAARPELAELYSLADLQSLADEFSLRLLWAGRVNRRMEGGGM